MDSVEEISLKSSDEEAVGVGTERRSALLGCDSPSPSGMASFEDVEIEEINNAPCMKTFMEGITYRKLDCNSLLVCIAPRRKLYFSGKVLVQVLKGKVEIFGYTFGVDHTKYAAFSAKGHSSLLSITALPQKDISNIEMDTIETGHVNVSSEELQNSLGVVIIMEGFENEWCEGFRHLYPQHASDLIGPSITGIGPGRTPKENTILDKLGFQFVKPGKNVKLLEFPAYFDGLYKDLIEKYGCSSGKICPFGGQSVGKSTFVKWLVNKLLSSQQSKKVLFLDLDPGQSEFTPPGLISVHLCTEPILGPNFSHMKQPIRAFYLGGVNVADTPVSYIKGVAELEEFCSSQPEFQGIPWIVNTMGFSQGLGVHLACEIIKIVRPKCVVQIQIDNDSRSFPFLLNKDNVSNHRTYLSSHLPAKYQTALEDYPFFPVRSACNREDSSNNSGWGADRKKARKLTLISYFAENVGNSEGLTLQSVIPLRVPLDSIAVGTISSSLSYDKIIDTLTGNLVALCIMSESVFQHTRGNKKMITKAMNYSNSCVGYGLARAYDKCNNLLYVVTPVQDRELLENVNVILAAGAIGIPVGLCINSGKVSKTDEMLYVMSREGGANTLHTAARKFYVPKRVTHSVLKNCLL